VVDCFDALTSDRPYRPRLSDDEALDILFQRRGTMYDPLIVDTFAQVYREIAPEPVPVGDTRRALEEITSSTAQPGSVVLSSRTANTTTSADEMLTLFESAHALAGHASVSDSCDAIAKHVHQLIPSALCVFYSYDAATDELEARHATGECGTEIKGMRIDLGHRLSGWVAANRRTIANSDPVLDLGEIARTLAPPLLSSLSTPLLFNDELVGVLTLYSRVSEAFGEDQRSVLDAIAPDIAYSFKRARDLEKDSKRKAFAAPQDRERRSGRTTRA
jgi:GAF domain-containing protein